MFISKPFSAALACSALAASVWADTAPVSIRALAATCASCHGTNGQTTSGSAVPGLAGLKADHIVAQMQAFKSGARPATVMHQLAKGYTDEQVAQIAQYLATQKP